MPSRRVGSPDPAMVFRPATKSTSLPAGISKGSHASCVGETWTLLLLGRKFDSVSGFVGRSLCSLSGLYHVEQNHHAHKSLMGDRGSCTVKPGTFVQVPGRYKSRSCHLLRIQAKSDISRAVLSLRQRSRNSLRCETMSMLALTMSAELLHISCLNVLIVESRLVLTRL